MTDKDRESLEIQGNLDSYMTNETVLYALVKIDTCTANSVT